MVVLRGGQLATRIRHLELWWIAETLRFAEPLLVQNASRSLPRADSIMTSHIFTMYAHQLRIG
jgi:hypothetical protein